MERGGYQFFNRFYNQIKPERIWKEMSSYNN